MLNQSEVDTLAADLFRQHEARQIFKAFPERMPTMTDAENIQEAYVSLLLKKEQAEVGGYKVALTSKQTRDWLNIQEPCAGQVLSTRIHRSPSTIKTSDYVRFSLEPEVCVLLDRDMAGPCTIDDVRRTIRSLHCSYELVEDRGADLTRLDAKSLTADNSWNAGIVIGPPARPDLDLESRRGRLSVNGRQTQEGTTAETMGGNPLHAVVWLAGYLGRRGRAIKAGQPVITGSIIQSQFLKAGDVAVFAMDDMPPVELRLE